MTVYEHQSFLVVKSCAVLNSFCRHRIVHQKIINLQSYIVILKVNFMVVTGHLTL